MEHPNPLNITCFRRPSDDLGKGFGPREDLAALLILARCRKRLENSGRKWWNMHLCERMRKKMCCPISVDFASFTQISFGQKGTTVGSTLLFKFFSGTFRGHGFTAPSPYHATKITLHQPGWNPPPARRDRGAGGIFFLAWPGVPGVAQVFPMAIGKSPRPWMVHSRYWPCDNCSELRSWNWRKNAHCNLAWRFLFICIHLYLSRSIYVYLYLSISIYIYLYPSLSTYIYLFLSLSIYIYLYLCVSIYIYLYLSMSIYIYLYLSISICIYLYLSSVLACLGLSSHHSHVVKNHLPFTELLPTSHWSIYI